MRFVHVLCIYYFSKILACISAVSERLKGGGDRKKIVAQSRVHIILHFCHVNFGKVFVSPLERKFCRH